LPDKGHNADCKVPPYKPDSERGHSKAFTMRSSVAGNRNPSAKALLFATFLWTAASLPIWAVSPGIRIVHDSDVLEVEAVAPNIVRVHFQPAGKVTPRTLVMDPAFQPVGADAVHQDKNGAIQTLYSDQMKVIVNEGAFTVQVQDASGKAIVTFRKDSRFGGAARALRWTTMPTRTCTGSKAWTWRTRTPESSGSREV